MRTATISSVPLSLPGSPIRMGRLPTEGVLPIQGPPRPMILGGVPPTAVPILKPLPFVPRISVNPGEEFSNMNSDFSNGIGSDDMRISNAFNYLTQGDLEKGVNMLVEYLTHTHSADHEKIIMKISEKLQISQLN